MGHYQGVYGSATAAKGVYNEICEMTLPPGDYILIGFVSASISDINSHVRCSLDYVSGLSIYFYGALTTMAYGGGANGVGYAHIEKDTTIKLTSYGYSSLTYKFNGSLQSIRIK